jgi:hypothetical protein
MSNYHSHKQSRLRSGLIPRSEAEAARLPEQVADYISLADTRFDDIAHLYLNGLTVTDLQYMEPEDLINVVPPGQHEHKLLMSILVRRYLFRDDDEDGIVDIAQGPGDIVDTESNDRPHIHPHPPRHSNPRHRKHDGRKYDDRKHNDRKHDERSDFCKCLDCASSVSNY